jgi:hypothetical protein
LILMGSFRDKKKKVSQDPSIVPDILFDVVSNIRHDIWDNIIADIVLDDLYDIESNISCIAPDVIPRLQLRPCPPVTGSQTPTFADAQSLRNGPHVHVVIEFLMQHRKP